MIDVDLVLIVLSVVVGLNAGYIFNLKSKIKKLECKNAGMKHDVRQLEDKIVEVRRRLNDIVFCEECGHAIFKKDAVQSKEIVSYRRYNYLSGFSSEDKIVTTYHCPKGSCKKKIITVTAKANSKKK
ncbi:MAG: hypothetical protein GY861_28105 [bacterium]|nr:hypothetical protein [bacterium]